MSKLNKKIISSNRNNSNIKMCGKWTRDSTKALITLFKQKPILYNASDISYYNRMKREEALMFIENRLKKLGAGITVNDIKKKIKTIRAQFNNEQNMIKARNSMKAGTGIGNGYTPKLWCYDRLKFLEEFNKCKEEDLTNSDEDIYEDSEGGSETICNRMEYDEISNDTESKETMPAIAIGIDNMLHKKPKNIETRTHPEHTRKFVDYISGEMTKIIDIEILEDAQFTIISILRDAIKKDRQKRLYQENPLWENQSDFDCGEYAESIISTKTVSSHSSTIKLVNENPPPPSSSSSSIIKAITKAPPIVLKESPFSNPHGTIILKNMITPSTVNNSPIPGQKITSSSSSAYNNSILSE